MNKHTHTHTKHRNVLAIIKTMKLKSRSGGIEMGNKTFRLEQEGKTVCPSEALCRSCPSQVLVQTHHPFVWAEIKMLCGQRGSENTCFTNLSFWRTILYEITVDSLRLWMSGRRQITGGAVHPRCHTVGVWVSVLVRAIQLWEQIRPFIESARGSRSLCFSDGPACRPMTARQSVTHPLPFPMEARRRGGPQEAHLVEWPLKPAISGKYVMMPRSKQTPSGLSEAAGAHLGTG